MGRCYIKPSRDSENYIEWSSVVDSVTGYGTRDEFLEYEREERGRQGVESANAALDRADVNGTSDRHIGFGAWDDHELRIMEGGGPGYIKRADLEQYAILMCQNTDEATEQAKVFIRPDVFEDDEVPT